MQQTITAYTRIYLPPEFSQQNGKTTPVLFKTIEMQLSQFQWFLVAVQFMKSRKMAFFTCDGVEKIGAQL